MKQTGARAIDSSLRDIWCNGEHHYTRPPADSLCHEASVRPGYSVTSHHLSRLIQDAKGAKPAEWPDDIRLQEFPA
jgi:hypothetical protein